ncbi:hypothetical protein ACQP2T_26430 [Nonomuraea sp. CA-143628]|uniref:hypothetical protein n=1 Tax=Nonomuraea sp. CA-143628 TaxID=3239997 RepID=UPI003D922397
MRPRLRDDVRYVPSDEGAYIHADHGACTLKGAQAYELLKKLAPYLTGEHTLTELVAALPADRRLMVVRLVETLAGQGFVVEAADEEPHGLSECERRIYAAEIAFVRHRLGSAERRFERLREARVTLAGHGPVLLALLEAGLVSGWRQVRVAAPAEEAAKLEYAAARARRDEAQRVRVDTAQPLWADADVVFQIGTETADLLATAQACPAGASLGQILLRPTEAWIVGPGPAAPAISCWLRLGGLPHHDEHDDGTDLLAGPVPAVLAAQPALSCFAHLTGLAEGQQGHATATRVDLHTLEMRRHRVVPWVSAVPYREGREGSAPGVLLDGADGLRATVERLQAAEPISPEELLERATRYVDPRTGLLGTLDEEDLVQVPVSVCRAVVSDPRRILPSWAPAPRVVGWGRDRRTARVRALLAACATYGVLTAENAETWGLEPLTGRPRRVPAPSFTVGGRPPIGVGAGLSWAAALAAGLRSHAEVLLLSIQALAGPCSHAEMPLDTDATTGGCSHTEVLPETHASVGGCSHTEVLPDAHASAGRSSMPDTDARVGARVSPEDVADAEAAHLLALLRTAGERLEIRDLTGVLQIPAYAVAYGSAISVACATTPGLALRDAVERALLAWQARTARQPAYADPVPSWWAGEEPPEWKLLAEALQAAGHVPVVVPMHHDAAAAELLPYVVRVVLCDD